MKTKLLLLALFLAGTFAVVASAEAITISIGEQPPLISAAGGIINQVAKEALSRQGYEVKFDWLPIGRMLKSLENDSLAVYITPSNTPGQQYPHIDFLAARGVFFYLKARFPDLKVTRMEDLAGKRIGTVINSPLKPMFEKYGILVDEGPFETMFTKLEAGRVDFTSTADVGGLLTIRKLFPGRETEFDFTDFSYTEIRAGLFVKDATANPKLLSACRAGFAGMKQDGTLARMLQAFFCRVAASRVKVL